MKKILIINGPNLNLLGEREQDIYGFKSLDDIQKECIDVINLYQESQIMFFQSNIEGEIINKIHWAKNNKVTDIIINAGAYSHTSVAIYDALLSVTCNIYELHISNVFKREKFRHNSYMSKVAKAVITGLGTDSYRLLVEYICRK